MFRVVIFSACLCAVSAFAPTSFVPGTAVNKASFRSSYSLQHAGSSRRMGAAPLRMGFSFPGKKQPEKPKQPWGDQNPYRIFGVTEDAPYEEVELAYKQLVEENKDNEKYCMQLEMMKEKIFDDRLYARMSGALKAKVQSPWDNIPKKKKDPWWKKIEWLKDIVQLPTKKYALQVSALMACFIFAGLAAPQLASTTMGFGFLSSMGFLYNRGTPEIARDDQGNPGESRPANYPALVKTIAICSIFAGLGFSFAQVLITGAALPASIVPDAVVNTFFNLGLWFAALFFQVQFEV